MPTFDKEVIDYVQGDVTGSGGFEEVYLIGNIERLENGGYVTDLELVVNIQNKQEIIRTPIVGEGYTPTMFLGDFTGNRINDVLISIFMQPFGAPQPLSIYGYIYSFADEVPAIIFDSESFNVYSTAVGTYMDNYRVEVDVENPGRKYRMDISLLDPSYLQSRYDSEGNLVEPGEVVGTGLIFLNPVDILRDRVYGFSAIQSIYDPLTTVEIGLIETFMNWNSQTNSFEPESQYISILGVPLESVEQ
jgi:hypothetical protein